MVNESIVRGNDVTCHAGPVVLYSVLSLVFRKKINVTVKNKATTIFHGLPSYRHRNDTINVHNFAVKPLACGLFYDITSMVCKSVYHGKLWSIFQK